MSLFSTSTHLAQTLPQESNRDNPLDTVNQLGNDDNTFATASKFFDDLKYLSDRINLKLKPDGSQFYPARSCRDIADYYPSKPNGRTKSSLVFLTNRFTFLQAFILSIQMKVQKATLYLYIVN